MKDKFARFIVVPDRRGLVLGKNFGLLKSGVLYQANEILDEFIVRELGNPDITYKTSRPNWNNAAEDLIESGRHLYTKAEWEMLCQKGRRG